MMLNVQGLRTGYGRIPILNGVSFAVSEGEFIGILGHNGMGKTTLLKALMGFLPATAGSRALRRQRCHDGRALSPRAARARLCAAGTRDFPGADGLRQSAHGLHQAGRRANRTPSTRCWRSFPASSRCSIGRAARCRAASSNCWRSRAAFAASRASSCSTSRPRASSPRSSTRSSRPCSGCATTADSP